MKNGRWIILTVSLLLGFTMLGVLLARPTVAAPSLQATATPVSRPDSVAVFEEVTDVAGVTFTGAQFGAAWGDYDDDTWPDLFVSNHFQDNPNIYHNKANGTFSDEIANLGAVPPISSRDIHGSTWGDADNDGDLDLYLTTNRHSLNLFYRNQGGILFFEEAVTAGIGDSRGAGRSASWIDYNNDGALDLFVGNDQYSAGPDKLFRNNHDGTFADVSNSSGLRDVLHNTGQVWGDYDDDGDMDLVLTGGDVRLHRNNGNGTFTNVSTAAGLGIEGNSSYGADFGDYDNDGDMDLYVTRGGTPFFDHLAASSSVVTYTFRSSNDLDGFDFQSSSSEVTFEMYVGSGAAIFLEEIFIGRDRWNPTEMPFTLGGATQHYGAPALSKRGIYIWQSAQSEIWHVRVKNIEDTQGLVKTPGILSDVAGIEDYSFVNPPRPNRLYQNQGDGTFVEVGSEAGVASVESSHTGTWGDYNNDGLLDLYVVNSGDVSIGDQPNHLYRNNGNGTFTNVAAAAGIEARWSNMDDCAAWADYDRNGFLDLFVTNEHRSGYLSGPHKLYRNLGNGNYWLEIKLVGTKSNRHGVGSKVMVLAGGTTQTRFMNNGAHYHCQNSSVLHFGLEALPSAQTITITWPSGQQQVWQNVPANQLLVMTEPVSEVITGVNSSTVHLPIILDLK